MLLVSAPLPLRLFCSAHLVIALGLRLFLLLLFELFLLLANLLERDLLQAVARSCLALASGLELSFTPLCSFSLYAHGGLVAYLLCDELHLGLHLRIRR